MPNAYTVKVSTVDEYLTYLRQDRGRSEATTARYGVVLRSLSAHVGGDPIAAKRDDVEGWYATTRGSKPATRANALSAVRSYYTWARRWDHRTDDPVVRLDAPAVDNAYPRPIGASDLDAALNAATDGQPHLRRAVALGAYGGLRVAEAAGLTWADVDLERRVMYVRGKGGKQRVVPVSPLLYDYIAPEAHGPVIGAHITANSLSRQASRALSGHGIGHTFHDMRKRGASVALAKGASPQAVMQMFGWSSLDTVKHYAAASDSELHRVAELMQ